VNSDPEEMLVAALSRDAHRRRVLEYQAKAEAEKSALAPVPLSSEVTASGCRGLTSRRATTQHYQLRGVPRIPLSWKSVRAGSCGQTQSGPSHIACASYVLEAREPQGRHSGEERPRPLLPAQAPSWAANFTAVPSRFRPRARPQAGSILRAECRRSLHFQKSAP